MGNKVREMPFEHRLVKELNEKFGALYNVTFGKDPHDRSSFITDGSLKALNRFGSINEFVKSKEWFNEFSFFIKVSLKRLEVTGKKNCKNQDEMIRIFTAVSFFVQENSKVKQMFRADWDNYRIADNTIIRHPQPHWHFTYHIDHQLMNNEGEIFDKLKEDEGIEPFKILDNTHNSHNNNLSIELGAMHFAMSGGWHNSGMENMVNPTNNESELVNWLLTLFLHVEQELQYISKKSHSRI